MPQRFQTVAVEKYPGCGPCWAMDLDPNRLGSVPALGAADQGVVSVAGVSEAGVFSGGCIEALGPMHLGGAGVRGKASSCFLT